MVLGMTDFDKGTFNEDLFCLGLGSASGAECCLNSEIASDKAARALPINKKHISRIRKSNKIGKMKP